MLTFQWIKSYNSKTVLMKWRIWSWNINNCLFHYWLVFEGKKYANIEYRYRKNVTTYIKCFNKVWFSCKYFTNHKFGYARFKNLVLKADDHLRCITRLIVQKNRYVDLWYVSRVLLTSVKLETTRSSHYFLSIFFKSCRKHQTKKSAMQQNTQQPSVTFKRKLIYYVLLRRITKTNPQYSNGIEA